MKEYEYEYDLEVNPHFEKDLDSILFENISKNDNDFFYFNNFESEDSLNFFLNMDKISVNCHSEKSLDMNISPYKENIFKKRFKILNIPKIGEFFKISKMFKNYRKGRIKKNDNYIGKHNKFSEDNMIKKIKKRFIERCRKYINYKYNQYLLKNQKKKEKTKIKRKEFLKRISPQISGQTKKRDVIKWLNSSLREAYSVDISKYSCKGNKERDYNIKNINKLYEDGEATEVINLLNKNVKDLFLEYCSDEKKEGFVKLNDDLEEIKKNMLKEKEENINEYIEQYKNTAKNLENIFIRKSERICKQ